MTPPDTKRCSCCSKELPLTEFYLLTSRKDGSQRRDYYCKECRRMTNRSVNIRAAQQRGAHKRALLDVGEGMKRCPDCGRALPLTHFYRNRESYGSYCKDCSRKRNQAYKDSKRKRGVFASERDGRLRVRGNSKGCPPLYWTGDMLSLLRRYYPNTNNHEVAAMIGVSSYTVTKKARELGIVKNREYLRKIHADSIALNRLKRKYNRYEKQ